MATTVTRFRPVGEKLEVVRASGMRELPPTLPGQPMFYLVPFAGDQARATLESARRSAQTPVLIRSTR